MSPTSTTEDLLVLYATDSKDLDGEVPPVIHLENAFKQIGRRVIVLGRGSPANPVDIRIVARKNGKEIISRKHAVIEMSVDKATQRVRYVIKDVGALNGVYVNNCRIKDHVLSHGDIVQFGGLFNMPLGEMLTISDISVRYQYFSSTSNDALKKRPSHFSEEASPLVDTDVPVRKKLKFSNQDISTQGSTPSNGVPKISAGSSSSNKNAKSNSSAVGSGSGIGSGAISAAATATATVEATNRKGSTPEPSLERSLLQEASIIRDLKMKLSQLDKEIAECKKSAQESASRAREEALAKSKFSREILALQQSLSQRDHSIVNLTEQLRLSSERVTSMERKAQEVDLTPSLPVAALRADLTCVLCNKMLLETVVLHCSHGFCRVCLEFRLQGMTGGRKEGRLSCPTCNLTCLPRRRPIASTPHSTKAQGNSHFYNRSDHIDRVIERILEKSSATLQNEYKDRDAAARTALQNLGINPDLTLVDEDDTLGDSAKMEEYILQPASSSSATVEVRGQMDSMKVGNGELLVRTSNNSSYYSSSNNISSSNNANNNTMRKEIFCDYCGGFGHLEVDCPHDNRQSDDEDDDDSD